MRSFLRKNLKIIWYFDSIKIPSSASNPFFLLIWSGSKYFGCADATSQKSGTSRTAAVCYFGLVSFVFCSISPLRVWVTVDCIYWKLLGRTPCSVVAGHAALFVLLVAIVPIDIMITDCKTLRRTGI